jgi:dolichol-phosphate mannosyltransferase
MNVSNVADGSVDLIVPCYNEVESLPSLVQGLSDFKARTAIRDFGVIFVDDGSEDGTHDLLVEAARQHRWMSVIRHESNFGIAAATLTGARASASAAVATIDADGSYSIDTLPGLLAELKPGVDVVTASPYHKLGKVVDVPPWRLALSRGASMLYRMLLRQNIATYTSCFRVYRRGALLNLELSDGGFTGIAEILALIILNGGRVAEVPAVLSRRTHGRSKMRIVRTVGGHLRLLGRLSGIKLKALIGDPQVSRGRRFE